MTSHYLSTDATEQRIQKLVTRINLDRQIVPRGVYIRLEDKDMFEYPADSDYWKLPKSMRIRCAMER